MSYECDRSADQWELYSSSMDCTKAAEGINKAVTKAVREAKKKYGDEKFETLLEAAEWARDQVYEVMKKYSKYGARDTEPSCNLVSEIESALGLEEYALDR